MRRHRDWRIESGELVFLFGWELGPDLHRLGRISGVDPHRLSFLKWAKAIEEVGLLQSRTAGVDNSLSRGSLDELMMAVASS